MQREHRGGNNQADPGNNRQAVAVQPMHTRIISNRRNLPNPTNLPSSFASPFLLFFLAEVQLRTEAYSQAEPGEPEQPATPTVGVSGVW